MANNYKSNFWCGKSSTLTKRGITLKNISRRCNRSDCFVFEWPGYLFERVKCTTKRELKWVKLGIDMIIWQINCSTSVPYIQVSSKELQARELVSQSWKKGTTKHVQDEQNHLSFAF
jgi:hypothetical protein